MSHITEQKKIAKNTIFLYLRMFVVLLVSFYTSRIILDKLGIDDYGIYSIVGSVVISFAFVKNSLQSATQRFLSYSKGENGNNSSSVFSMSMNIHILFMLIVFILLETVGLWFFYNVIEIPLERQSAAKVVYQLSLFTFCLSLIQIPYLSLILSNEKMEIYAYLSIFEVVLKLVIVYLLTITDSIDKLIFYGALMMLVTVVNIVLTIVFCKIKIGNDCVYKILWNKKLFKEILSFSSWNLVGGISGIACTEGPNYFINIFLGVKANAAMGIAKQVSNYVYGFSSNFQNAFNPQIVKSYAAQEYKYMFDLIFRTSKLSFILLYIFAAPFIVCRDDFLHLWLTIVPNYTSIFCALILLSQLVTSISSPLWMAAHAVGNIRNYQLSIVAINFSIIPIAWLILKYGLEPFWVLAYQFVMNLGILIYRVCYLDNKVNFPSRDYMFDVVFKCLVLIPFTSMPILYFIHSLCDGLISIVLTSISSIIIVVPLFVVLGLSKKERIVMKSMVVFKFKSLVAK